MCPSDCGTTTTTTTMITTTTTTPSAVCGNSVCEDGENQLSCPADCIEITLETTTTTQPSGPSMPTGMFAAFTGNLNFLILILTLIALVLGVFRFKILPIIIKRK